MDRIDSNMTALGDTITRTTRVILHRYRHTVVQQKPQTDPISLSKSLRHLIQLFEVCDNNLHQGYHLFTDSEISELGNQGLIMLDLLANWANQLKLKQEAKVIHDLNLPLALWIVRHGGVIETLEPVVDAISDYANQTYDAEALGELALIINEIIGAIAKHLQSQTSQHQTSRHNMRAWRTLNMNQSIVATRSHDINLMATAFERLINDFPDDALNLLSDGIRQLERHNYPAHVRYIMWEYFQKCLQKHTLH